MMSAPRKTYQAIWNGAVLAESDRTVQVEGNQYFPPESINPEYFRPSDQTTVCYWKGTASYYTLEVDGRTNRDAAWFYPHPSAAARHIKDRIAFWKGVRVVEAGKSEPETGVTARGLLSQILD
ncbi:DUF427 domain-containing protein [Arthrobacter sp. M4]|uniref:DUF427 domain-containing protein n=1 Tax=Arthrobacter sp. M4 TaxID=218160 RepID=UPI001CDD157C|nr:DUF427 domain-containing protein [Arthrobacter sp. M4]MCA4134861.1 DUF427 domain-containing protein [Arthrobacter sp. M4]